MTCMRSAQHRGQTAFALWNIRPKSTLRSSIFFAAGFAFGFLCCLSWLLSSSIEDAPTDQCFVHFSSVPSELGMAGSSFD